MIENTVNTLKRNILLIPGLAWIFIFLILPCILIISLSFFERGIYGGIDYNFNFENYSRVVEFTYLKILLNSSKIAFLSGFFAVLFGYPAAYFIYKAPAKYQIALLFLVMLPFWSNYLIRTYAWMVLLNNQGLINTILINLNIIKEPLNILYTEFSVIIGLIYNYLPFVILSIYSSVSKLDQNLIEASKDLGGSSIKTFFLVTLPLTLPGVAAGFIFVFVLSIGNFITPDLLGGGKFLMIGNLIYDQFLSARDWPFGASLSFVLISIMLFLLFLQSIFVRKIS
ncbi:MAG: ABC transporter permease [Alphaproteobacteria bacterium]|nr:ABC transporter permease [Alphaproteobacteria bacterium]